MIYGFMDDAMADFLGDYRRKAALIARDRDFSRVNLSLVVTT